MRNIARCDKRLFLLWFLLGLYHIVTLSYSPLPWFDETFFASISRAVMEGKGLTLQAAPFYMHDKPVLIYGPVYFYVQAGIMWALGFSEWVFRLLNLLAAAGVLIFVNYILRTRIQKPIRISIVLLLAFDTIFLQNAHSGRMDMLAFLFVFISYLPILKKRADVNSLSVSSFLALVATLTTPRAVVFLLPLACWLLYILVKEKKIIPVLAFGIIFLSGYFLWIVIGFGEIKAFLSYYSDASVRKGSRSLMEAFAGGNFNIQTYQMPMILITIGTLFIPGRKWTWLSFICITNIIVFYLFIKDTGIYSSLVVSFWLILLAENINSLEKYAFNIQMIPVAIIGIISIGIFLVKAVIVFGSWEKRDPSNISEWVSANIPSGSRVVGDYKYFYAVIKNGSDFQFIGLGGEPAERLAYQLHTYRADFILVSSETESATLQTYVNGIDAHEKIEISLVKSEGKIYSVVRKLLEKLSVNFSEGYEGEMYKINR